MCTDSFDETESNTPTTCKSEVGTRSSCDICEEEAGKGDKVLSDVCPVFLGGNSLWRRKHRVSDRLFA